MILRGNSQYWTLIHLKYQRHQMAENGEGGHGAKSHGRNGRDIVLEVPLGTVAKDAETGEVVAEVTEEGQEVILVRGDAGGWETGTSGRRRIRRHGMRSRGSRCRRGGSCWS